MPANIADHPLFLEIRGRPRLGFGVPVSNYFIGHLKVKPAVPAMKTLIPA